MAERVKTVHTVEEMRDIVEELKLDIDKLDDVENLLPRANGGICDAGCEKGCQACQPGNRYATEAEGSDEDDDEEDE